MYSLTYNDSIVRCTYMVGFSATVRRQKAFRREHFDASVSTKALLMLAMLTTESWATEIRSCPCPQCDSASG